MRRLLLLLLGFVLACTQILAQRTLAGKVQDENGQPIAGARVNFAIGETQPALQSASIHPFFFIETTASPSCGTIHPRDFESITIWRDASSGNSCPSILCLQTKTCSSVLSKTC